MSEILEQGTREELARGALEHYDLLSGLCCNYYNLIPKCIDAWLHLPAFEKRITELEHENARLREVIEKIREITAEFSYDRKLEQIRDIVNQLCQPQEAE